MEVTLIGGPYGGRSFDDDATEHRFVLVGIQPDGSGGLIFCDERIEIYRLAGTTGDRLTYEYCRTLSQDEFPGWAEKEAVGDA